MFTRETIPDGATVGPDPSSEEPVRNRMKSAGFGSPGEDVTVRRIDLNEALIRHPQATFVMRAEGDAMAAAGISSKDVLLVDRSIAPAHGNVVIAAFEGHLVCRRIYRANGITKLEAASPGHRDLIPGDGVQLEVWGVVTTVIKSLLA